MGKYQYEHLEEIMYSIRNPDLMNAHVLEMKRCWSFWTMPIFNAYSVINIDGCT